MQTRKTKIVVFASLFWHTLANLCLIAHAATPAKQLVPGDQAVTLMHDGRERISIVHMPRGASEARALPVVLNFHGGGGHGANEQEYSLMDRLADRESFIAVYPNGTGRLGKRLLTWNAGTCCGYAAVNNIDDAGYVRSLIAKMAEMIPIDRRRIYGTGLSNGGMMAYRLAAEAGDIFAAVAPVAGGMVLPAIKSARAVPVMHIHSVDDPRAIYSGGLGPPFPLTNNRVFHASIDQMIVRWVNHNGCVALSRSLPSAAPTATGAAIQRRVTSTPTAATALRSCCGNLAAPAMFGRAESRNTWSASSARRRTSSTRTRRCGISSSDFRCSSKDGNVAKHS